MCINAIYALHVLLSPFCAGKYKQGSKIVKVHKKFAISENFANSKIGPGSVRRQRSFGEVQEAEMKKLAISHIFAISENLPGRFHHQRSFSESQEVQVDKRHVVQLHWCRGRFHAFR